MPHVAVVKATRNGLGYCTAAAFTGSKEVVIYEKVTMYAPAHFRVDCKILMACKRNGKQAHVGLLTMPLPEERREGCQERLFDMAILS